MNLLFVVVLFSCVSFLTGQTVQSVPPFSGTIFLSGDIITSLDSSSFESVTYTGQGSRTMFDRRVNKWITVNAYLFNALFNDGLSAEIQVNPEFSSSDLALVEAEKYGPIIGRLPTVLRSSLQTVWIHKGTNPFGGGNNNLLIHTGQTALYEADGILEETFVHEASHTSLDGPHAASLGWLAAQTADGEFISTYARDNPDREDIAESFLTYLAIKYRSDRISAELIQTITQTIPNRIAYFDAQQFAMYPIVLPTTNGEESFSNAAPKNFLLQQNYPNPFNPTTVINYQIPITSFVSLIVYDALGREVATLVNEQKDANIYSIQWNASQFANGIYFYTMRSGSFVQTKKLLLVR